MPMSASAIVHREDVLDLIDRARQAVPMAVHRAEGIVADADAVLAEGREESERIIRRAHDEAERLVSAENVVRMANDRADEIIKAAEDRSSQLRRGADDYCERTLGALETELDRVAEQVRAGRDVLAGRLSSQTDSVEIADPAPRADSGRRRAGWSVDPAAKA